MPGNKIRFGFDVDDGGAVRKINGVSQAFDRLGGKGSGASLFGNVGAKAVAVGFNLIGDAVDGTVGFLGDAVRAFNDDAASVAKLTQTLDQNIPKWRDHSAAIDIAIDKGMKLGFTDDDLRDSLGALSVATNDVSKSIDIQHAAMDLARLKNISLAEATVALIKVDDGHYRALQALGIVLPKNATSTDALRAVQKAAEGQAASYANTTRGRLTVAQVQMGEAMEKIGGAIMPVLATIMQKFSNDWLPALGRGWDKVRPFVLGVAGAINAVIGVIRRVIDWIGHAVASFNRINKAISDFLGKIGKVNGISVMPPIPGLPIPHFAEGGIVRTPTVALIGESGPEMVTPLKNVVSGGDTRGGGTGVTIQGISEREIMDMIDRGLYFRLQRAAPTLGRS